MTKIRSRAFTLIELLVVIAIIAIIAAILFPVFAAARVAARQAKCASNMRQIGIALSLYVEDYAGRFPLTSEDPAVYFHPDSNANWVFTLLPYLGKSADVLICPSDPKGAERLKVHSVSYVPNGYLALATQVDPFGRPIGPSAPNSFLLPRPAETMTFYIISDEQPPNRFNDHVHQTNWFANCSLAWGNILSDIQPDRHRVGVAPGRGPDRTQGSANYLYADGHVKSIPAGRVKGWADSCFDFAKPPQ